MAYVRLEDSAACGAWCYGNASPRILDTSNPARLRTRRKLGFRHVLVGSTCRLRLRNERSLSRCLDGRSLLLTSSTFNVDMLRGFALLNSSLAAWTRTRPGKVHPNVADFWRAFEKPSGSYCYKRGHCGISFGRGGINHISFHYPTGGGLANLRPTHYTRMCAADVLALESGYEDIAPHPSRRVNASDRLLTFASNLRKLLEGWRRCKAERGAAGRTWRPVYVLGGAPKAPTHPVAASADACLPINPKRRRVVEAHEMAAINELARRMVEGAGFEVFDAFSATLHASPGWFDKDEDRKAEPLADVTAQMLINQLCNADLSSASHVGRDRE